jgi:hypothetical protein
VPEGLDEDGKKAAKAILAFMRRKQMLWTGGCRAFWTPEEWLRRKEEFGHKSCLVVVHDGGYISEIVKDGKLQEQLQMELRKLGLYLEPCTCWYSAIYHA